MEFKDIFPSSFKEIILIVISALIAGIFAPKLVRLWQRVCAKFKKDKTD